MPDVHTLDTTNGHHEEPDVLSPLDDSLSPHVVSTSDAAGESTDETGPPPEHVEEGTKEEPPAQKAPPKTAATKPPGKAVKKARVTVTRSTVYDLLRNKLKLTILSIRLFPLDALGPVIAYLFCWASRWSVLANLFYPGLLLQVSNFPPPLRQ